MTPRATSAPDVTPIIFASARGFCNTACSKAPDTLRAAPTNNAMNILGMRKSITAST